MSYGRSVWEKMQNFLKYNKWRVPAFPANGPRDSIHGHVFQAYIDAASDFSSEDGQNEQQLPSVHGRAILYADEYVVVFEDRSPVATTHLLVRRSSFLLDYAPAAQFFCAQCRLCRESRYVMCYHCKPLRRTWSCCRV